LDGYKQAVKLDGDNAETQYALGLTYNKLGRSDEEILAYKRTLNLKPDHANAMEHLGVAVFKNKRYADAASAFEQLKTYKPDDKTYNYLGECYFEDGKVDQSIDAFNNAVAINPDLDK